MPIRAQIWKCVALNSEEMESRRQWQDAVTDWELTRYAG